MTAGQLPVHVYYLHKAYLALQIQEEQGRRHLDVGRPPVVSAVCTARSAAPR